MLIQPELQSCPSATGGMDVKVGTGVSVAGAGVEVGSPGGTVSVGTAVNVTVSVNAAIAVGEGAIGGLLCLFANKVIMVTVMEPQTPINAAIMEGSIFLGVLDIYSDLSGNFPYSTTKQWPSQV